MSLFKAREWWSTVSGYEEFHTNRLLVTTSLTPNRLQYDECVIVGSFSGILRCYRPQPGEYSPDNLLLEQQLDAPIIQLAIEHVVEEDSVTISLIVLHPRSVAIYSLTLDQPNQLVLGLRHKHVLSHVSYIMVTGPLGRTTGHDLICIQSMDGIITVIDHSDLLFTCGLSDFFLPGPMGYNPRTDTLVTVGSGRQLEVYRYQSLFNAGTHSSKHVKCEWSIELGEEAVDLKVAIQEEGPSLILVLGERNLYCFKDDSQLLFTKKLEHYFSVIHPYKIDDKVYYMLAGHSQQLQVMKNETMIWAAQLPHIPVAMTTANFSVLKGVIVTLDELGHLQCSYLGTDPTSAVTYNRVGGAHSDTRSVKEMDEEYKELQLKIEKSEENTKETVYLPLEVQIQKFGKPRPLETEQDDEPEEESEPLDQQVIDCVIKLTNPNRSESITDIHVNFDVATPINISPSSATYYSIGDSEEYPVTVTCSGAIPVGSLQATITVSYANEYKGIETVDHTFPLPLELISKPCAPQDGKFKVTLDSSSPCISLAQLYPDNQEGKSANAVALQLLSGPSVTIIVSKTSDKYRVQSDDFGCLGIIMKDLVERIKKHYHNQDQEVRLKVSSSQPLPEYFDIVDEHHKVRVGLEQCKELLSRHAHQFRAIQKRLLSRYKDKTPIGLSHFDSLLDGTHMQLLMLADKYSDLAHQEQTAMRKLSSSSQLLVTYLSLNANLANDETAILNHTFLLDGNMLSSEQGWEEVVDTGVIQLLRSCLAKSVKDQSTLLPEMTLSYDCGKLKRHIALLHDRIMKGGKLSVTRSFIEPKSTSLGSLPALKEDEEIEQ